MKKISRRYKKDIRLLVERLDKHGDGFRSTAVDTVEVKQEGTVKLPPRAGAKTQAGGKQADKQNAGGGKKPAPKRKSKADKVKRVSLY